jgi:hypothetical protein
MPNLEHQLLKAKEHLDKIEVLRKNKEHIIRFIEQLSAEGRNVSRGKNHSNIIISKSRLKTNTNKQSNNAKDNSFLHTMSPPNHILIRLQVYKTYVKSHRLLTDLTN